MRLEIALLPYHSSKRHLYGVEFTRGVIGSVRVSYWGARLKSLVGLGASLQVPVVRCQGYVGIGGVRLRTTRYRIRYATPSWLRERLIRDFGYLLVEEGSWVKPSTAFSTLRWAKKGLTTYYVVTSSHVYPKGFEPQTLTTRKYVLSRSLVVFIS